METIIPILITIIALSFYSFMTGITGVIILLVIIALVMIFVYFKQNLFLYMPSKLAYYKVVPGMHKSPDSNPFGLRHPSEHNLQSIQLNLCTSDGVNIRGWHVKAPNPKRVIVYFHQNAGNIGTRLYYVERLVNTNSDVILVAYRGYSNSQSVPSQQGIMKDGISIISYALSYSSDKNLPVYLLGRSLGGAVSIYLASNNLFKHKIRGLILQNTFMSISHMIDAIMPALKYFKFLQRNYWNSFQRIGFIKVPILFIKSMQDQIVPAEQMNQLISLATAPIHQFQIQNGTHNTSWSIDPKQYFSKINQFFYQVEK